jgi:hypothetical protein
VRACQSGTANASLPIQSPPQQRGVLQKRGSSRRPFKDMRKGTVCSENRPASRWAVAVAMDMPWSLVDGARCMLEACCWYRNQQSARECSSDSATVLRFSSATYSVAMNAALLRTGSCSTPLSCRTSQNRRHGSGKREAAEACVFVCAQTYAALHVCTVAYSIH